MEKAIPVILRVEGRRTKAPADRRDLLAVFPTEVGTNDPRTMVCYSTIGQHGACIAGYIGEKTRPATEEEQARMLRELRAVGYENLRVVSRASSAHAKARREQLRRDYTREWSLRDERVTWEKKAEGYLDRVRR